LENRLYYPLIDRRLHRYRHRRLGVPSQHRPHAGRQLCQWEVLHLQEQWRVERRSYFLGGALPEEPEDIGCDKDAGLMYTVTEAIDGRYVLPFGPTVLL